jgi:cyclase
MLRRSFHASRQRFSGATLSRAVAPRLRSVPRTGAFGGRPARENARLVQLRCARLASRLKEALDGLGNAPVKYVIDTHWHFDHTDNNAHLHAAGATVLAHENTKQRMSEPHVLSALYRGADGTLFDVHFDPSPAEALPQQTFAAGYKLQANGETLDLQDLATADTDGDIYVHFQKANVIQMVVSRSW